MLLVGWPENQQAKGFLITLFTNGTLITEEIADRFAALPPYRIEISLHGLAERTFEEVTRGKGSHERCMSAIQMLLDRKLPLFLKTTAMSVNKDEVLAIKRYVNGLGRVGYKLGEEMRPTLEGSDAPGQWALSDEELRELNLQDPALWDEACARQARAGTLTCVSGQRSFHIDAYGQLQLCSGNRRQSYDLRQGSFLEGFYNHLPGFACQWKASPTLQLIQPSATHV